MMKSAVEETSCMAPSMDRFKSGRHKAQHPISNCPQDAKGDPSGWPAPISQESVVAVAGFDASQDLPDEKGKP
jgi:hypothetical protein